MALSREERARRERVQIIKRALDAALPELTPMARQRLAEEVENFGVIIVRNRWRIEGEDFRLSAYQADRSTELSRGLRQARERAGIQSQTVLAKTRWSASKFSRIENGEVGVSVTDMLFLLTLYGVTDEASRQRFIELAEADRRRRRQR